MTDAWRRWPIEAPSRTYNPGSTSIYTPFKIEPVVIGAHLPGDRCPCGMTASDNSSHAECETCESFECPRCERWCSWEIGHGDCSLCDDCCVSLDTPCMEENRWTLDAG